VFPTSWLTVTNQSSLYNIRMVGNSYYVQIDNGISTTPVLPFEYLGILTFVNTTDAVAQVRPWMNVHGGFGYSDRQLGSIETGTLAGQPPLPVQTPIEQTNITRTGTLGFAFRPVKELTIKLDGQLSRASKPIYPISDANFHALRADAAYRT